MSQRDRTLIETFLGTLLSPTDEMPAQHSSWKIETQPVPDTRLKTKLAAPVDEALRLQVAQRLLAQAAMQQDTKVKSAPECMDTQEKVSVGNETMQPHQEAVAVSEQSISVGQSTEYFGRPDWAHGGFQTLIFKLGKLRLAVPLVKLGGIHKIDRKVTKLVGRPPWFMGLLNSPHGNIAVIDTAMWIMPERYEEVRNEGLDYDHVIMLDDTHWGLGATGVEKAKTFHEDEVQWSESRKKRPWMAGMLKEEMCALIDVDVFIAMLNGADEKYGKL